MAGGAFTDAARGAALTRSNWRCAGCGAGDPLTIQHRVARGMGGRSGAGADLVAHTANGLALCGSGTQGCHGWTEHNPVHATALGWRLADGTDPIGAPYAWIAPGATWEWVSVNADGNLEYVPFPHGDTWVALAISLFHSHLARRKDGRSA